MEEIQKCAAFPHRKEAEGRHFLREVINLPLAPQIDSALTCVYN